MEKKLSITYWPEDDRPREKLLKQGAQSLSNAELLAILIGTGYAETDAVMVMKQVLTQCNNNLNALGKMTARELMAFKGIGEAKAVTILAACELGKRRAKSDVIEQETLSSAEAIYRYAHCIIGEQSVEHGLVYTLIKAITHQSCPIVERRHNRNSCRRSSCGERSPFVQCHRGGVLPQSPQ